MVVDREYMNKARSETLAIKKILFTQSPQSFTLMFVPLTRSTMLLITRVTTYRQEVEAKGDLVFIVPCECDDYLIRPERGCNAGFYPLKVFCAN